MSRKNTPYRCACTLAETIFLCSIPALLLGCSSVSDYAPPPDAEEQSEYTVRLKSESGLQPSHTDLFVFNNDALRRIDAYQRVQGVRLKAASRVGEKILVAISNSTVEPDEWRRISSYDGLMEEISLLADENPDNPIMSGQTEINAGSGRIYELDMQRLMSKVIVKSLRADFSGTEYEGRPLTDVRIYLTNVNASCAIMKEDNFRPVMIVNSGCLDYTSLRDFKSEEMLYCTFPYNITELGIDTDIELCCYPNDTEEETYGSPFTRLVIEGRIAGETCYYPITVNREENGVCFGTDGSGIGRNCRYEYDITLCRFGTGDPDTPVSLDEVIVNCAVEPWTDKYPDVISF